MAHVASLATVAATFMYSPAPHWLRTGLHASPLSVLENVEPWTHGAHARSVVADPTVACPSPVEHRRHATHASLPAAALKVPLAHGVHTRSDEALAAAVSYSPAWHVVTA